MTDQWNDNIPAVANQIAADVADIEENMGWIQQILKMCIGYKTSTIATVSPPGEQRSKFRWKDADEIYIGTGRYFHDGTTRQMVFWDSEITFQLQSGGSNASSDDYGADGWHYIYLDDSAIVTQASNELDADCFLNDTTAPSYSAAKHGWYNGSDRCIFAVYETGDAILEFYHDGGDYVLFADKIAARAIADLDDTWTDVTLTIPGFSTKAMCWFFAYSGGEASTASMDWRTNGQTASTGHRIIYSLDAGVNDYANASAVVITDSSQIIEVVCSISGDDQLGVNVEGWYFPNGM